MKNHLACLLASLFLLAGCGSNQENFVVTTTQPFNQVITRPTAANDAYGTQTGQVLTVTANAGILVNDTVNGATIGQTSTTTAQSGTLSVNADGSFTYTPANGFTGSDSFTYTLTNSAGSSTATVTLTVTAPAAPSAPVTNNDSYNAATAQTLTVPVANGVLANDTANGATISSSDASSTQNGVVNVAANGSFTYTSAAGFVGTDTFTYTLTNATGSSTGTVTITVAAALPAPVAVNDAYQTAAATALNVPVGTGVLANDTVNSATITAFANPSNAGGAVALNADGSFTYTPPAGFNGADTFTYTLTNTSGPSTATVTVQVAAPVVRTFEAISVSPTGSAGNGDSGGFSPSMTADGRFVVFGSRSTNLVANDTGDTNNTSDVFLRDRQTGTTTRLSRVASGNAPNGYSGEPQMTPDGRFVAFRSGASDIVPNDTNGQIDIFVLDRNDGSFIRVSVDENGNQIGNRFFGVSISDDGRFVTFSENILPFAAQVQRVRLWDRQTGGSQIISRQLDNQPAEGSAFPMISGDGNFITYSSANNNIVAGDPGAQDVFLFDRVNNATTRISGGLNGAAADNLSNPGGISRDGRFVVIDSSASNLVTGDTNTRSDVFLFDRNDGSLRRVSLNSTGGQIAGDSLGGTLSADGRFFGFTANDQAVVPGDTNGRTDGFVGSVQNGNVVRATLGPNNEEGDDNASTEGFSLDGSFVFISSDSSNFITGDNMSTIDLFLVSNPLAP